MPSANAPKTPVIGEILARMKAHLVGDSMLGEMARDPAAVDPYRILISTVLSVRNRDSTTKKVSKRLFDALPTPEAQKNAAREVVEELIRSSGFYHTKARYVQEIAQIIDEEYAGRTPETFDELVALPGVGRKVANCVLVYAFDTPAIPVDTHVHRISNRLGLVDTKTPEKTEAALVELVPRQYWTDLNENFVKYGQQVCKPTSPQCDACPLADLCAQKFAPKIARKQSRKQASKKRRK